MLAHRSMTESLNHQRAVLRPKADTVAERNPDACFTRFIGDVVEVTIRVRFVKIDRRRDLVVVHRAERSTEPGGAARALRMADLRFGGRHGYPRSSSIKRQFQGAGLDSI